MTAAYTDLLTRQATLLERSAATEDALGDWTYVEVGSPWLVEIQPVSSGEEGEGALLPGRFRVFLPADCPATGWDALVIDGETYELAGDPAEYWLPLSKRLHHLEADVLLTR